MDEGGGSVGAYEAREGIHSVKVTLKGGGAVGAYNTSMKCFFLPWCRKGHTTQ
jgi:hypothetical protein